MHYIQDKTINQHNNEIQEIQKSNNQAYDGIIKGVVLRMSL